MMKLRRSPRREPAIEAASTPGPLVSNMGDADDRWDPRGLETYLAARAEWNERYGSYISQARWWRVAALLAMCVAGGAVGGVVYIGAQTHIVPFVVEVNQLGDALAAVRADVAATPDARLIRAQLGRWVSDVRTVLSGCQRGAAGRYRSVFDD